MPFVTTEESIASCGFCQALIEFMSSIVPGVQVMSAASILPQTVALEMSISWLFVPIIVAYAYLAYLRGEIVIKSGQIRSSVLFIAIGVFDFLIGKSGFPSIFYGTMATFKGSNNRNIIFSMLQSDTGISIVGFGINAFEGMLVFALLLILTSIIKSYKK
jgi:hypothetical protein